jgi:class 3 adenylate cyclase
MSIGLYASKIQAEVLADREALEKAYRDYPDTNVHWCIVDLAQSSNYRLFLGPEKGYIRGESFFTLIGAATRPYRDIRLIKEIGDAVLLCSDHFRPIFEACLLMLQAAKQLAYVAGDRNYPFSIRAGIDFGIAKRLSRRHEDYLGEPIDRLARIMTVRSATSSFLLSENAYAIGKNTLAEYKSICTASLPLQLKLPGAKQLTEQVIYRELLLAANGISDFTDYFGEWRKGVVQR